VQIWTPGIAGPLDELVARLTRMISAFAQEHDIEHAEVRVELADGSRHVLVSMTADPGFGFLSLVPHQDRGEPARRLVVPIGAVKMIEISEPDPERPFGFAVGEETRAGRADDQERY
jgi:hypothetical protein